LEYETIALNGSNLLINSIEILAKIDHLCDDMGVDTIETGNTLAVLMESGKLDWGDGDAVLEFLRKASKGEKELDLLGLGAYRLAKKLGVKRIPCVKKQGLPGYDPRIFKGMGVTFATSPMGADHTAGPAIKGRKAYGDKDYGGLTESKGKIPLSFELQVFVHLVDSCGLCYFVGPSWETAETLSKLLNAKFAWDKNRESLREMAVNWLNMEKNYNKEAGLNEFDQIPSFIANNPEPSSKNLWDVKDRELAEFWNQGGN